MKAISNGDYNLLVDKLPIVLQHARANIPAADTYAANAHRRLTALYKKLQRQNPTG